MKKKRLRAVGIIFLNGGLILLHRQRIKYRKLEEYYVLPGISCKYEEDLAIHLQREILNRIGIKVNIKDRVFIIETNDIIDYFYSCEYESGKIKNIKISEAINTDTLNSLKTIPQIVRKDEIESLYILPEGIKEKLLKEMSWEDKC